MIEQRVNEKYLTLSKGLVFNGEYEDFYIQNKFNGLLMKNIKVINLNLLNLLKIRLIEIDERNQKIM